MQIVQANGDATVFDSTGNLVYALRAGERYVLHDQETAVALRDRAVTHVEGIDRRLCVYRGELLRRHRLLLPFIGRAGDAMVVCSCLAALRERYPYCRVDVAAPKSLHALFELMPPLGELISYPVPAEHLERYDYYLSLEEVVSVPEGTARSCADVFSACMCTPKPLHPTKPVVTPCVKEAWEQRLARDFVWRGDRKSIAIHIGDPSNLRTYPSRQVDELASLLVAADFDVFLIGNDSALTPSPSGPEHGVRDLRGATSDPADLAAVFELMSAVMTGDSFPLHLAGALGVPTVAVFTATDAVLARDYETVEAISSNADCSPCRVATADCPLGHSGCIAQQHESIAPARIAEKLCAVLGNALPDIHASQTRSICAG